MFAGIVISNNIIDQTFEYYVPQKFQDYIKLGSRVKVNFGISNNKEVMGYVVELYEETRFEGVTKEITDVLDFNPLISKEQLELANYIAEDTVCPLSRVLNAMIPNAYKLKSIKYLIINDYCELDANLAMLFKGKSIIKMTKDLEPYMSLINKEIKKGNVRFSYDAQTFIKEKIVTKYLVNQQMLYEKKEFIRSDVLLTIDFIDPT